MGYAIGTLIKNGGDDCHYKLLALIKTVAEANGWVTLRYDTVSTNRELIMKSLGLSGAEEIYIGFQTYHSVPLDYYNLNLTNLTGYVSGNSFSTQPGYAPNGFCAHNNSITYYLSINAQRIIGCIKVGTPVYEHFGVGKFFPYARPGEYPSPIFLAGMIGPNAAIRFSDTTHAFPWTGGTAAYISIKNMANAWETIFCYPFTDRAGNAGQIANTARCLVPAGSYYQLEPIIMGRILNSTAQSNIWGELDGVYFVSGFSNGSENVVQTGGSSTVNQSGMTVLQAVDAILAVGGRAFVVLQNVYRATFRDYIALEMRA